MENPSFEGFYQKNEYQKMLKVQVNAPQKLAIEMSLSLYV